MGEQVRIRLGVVGASALDELRGIVSRHTGERVDYDAALDFVLRFYRAVDARERERVVNGLRRELGPRLSLPRPPS